MSKSSIPALVFNGVSLTVHQRHNQPFVSSSDIAKALRYRSEDTISRIYRRNADEFTPDMSETVKLTVSGNLQKSVRLFSLRGAHLLAMFSRTEVAKDFRKWVLDILDREIQRAKQELPDSILSSTEQTKINRRAHALAQQYYKPLRDALMADYLSGKIDDPEKWEPKKELDTSVDVRDPELFRTVFRHQRWLLRVNYEGRIDMIPVGPDAMVLENRDIPGMIREDEGGFSSELLRDTAAACFERLQKTEERLKRRLQQITNG